MPGADPDDWYGLAEPSTIAPLVDLDGDPEALVAISPSQIDRAEESPLGWFIDHVASPPSGLAASIGTIVHAVVEEVGARDDGDTSIETIWAAVEQRWRELRFEAGWVAERERRGARAWPRAPPTTSRTSPTTASCCSAPRGGSRSSSIGCASRAPSTGSRHPPTERRSSST